MNRASLFRFTFEGASPCSATPLIASEDGHIAIVFRDCIYLVNWDNETPILIAKIKSQAYAEPIRLRQQHKNFDGNPQSIPIYRALDHTKQS